MSTESPKRPKCIIMPFQEPTGSGLGLALHFLLGNVMAIHPGFAECWFGWRVGKIFSSPDLLRGFYRRETPPLDRTGISAEQKVRCFVYGEMDQGRVDLSLFDSDGTVPAGQQAVTVPFSTDDHLKRFRNRFLQWIAGCGLPMPDDRIAQALWPEHAPIEGLQKIGQALEQFYIYSAYGGEAELDLAPYEAAVQAAPESFMAHNLLGWAHYRNENAAAAKAAFQRALGYNPHAAGTMAGLMWCAVLEKDEAGAVHWASEKAATQLTDVASAAEAARRRFH